MSMYIYIYIYTCICVCMYVYIYIYTCISLSLSLSIYIYIDSYGDLTVSSPTISSETTTATLLNNDIYCQRGDIQGHF